MSYYIVITTNPDQFEFVRVNGHIKQFAGNDEVLDNFKDAIKKYGSDNVKLLEVVILDTTIDVKYY